MSDEPWNKRPDGKPWQSRRNTLKTGQSITDENLAKLREVQVILVIVGILTIGLNIFDLMTFEQSLAQARANGASISNDLIQHIKMVDMAAMALGAVFVALAIFVYKAPLLCTIAALLLYIVGVVAFAVVVPETLMNGLITKVFIVIGLAEGIRAAAAIEANLANEPLPSEAYVVPPRSESSSEEFPGFGPGSH